MMRRYLVATLALAAVASTAAGSVFAGDDTDQTLRRMGEGATRLTARIVEKPLNLKSLLASSPGEPTPFEHSSGYFKLNRTKSAEMFYFYFKSRSTTPSKDPVVLWMTGGPGCSSELAVFYENGPVSFFLCSFIRAIRLTSCFIYSTASPPNSSSPSPSTAGTPSATSCTSTSPINTGFSYSDDPSDAVHDEAKVADDMVQFLAEFVQVRFF